VKGNTVSLSAPVMAELAEELVDMVSIAEWAFFAKNGADPTNLSVMVARAATGRKKVIVFEGFYHGSSPWMQASGSAGTIEEDSAHVIRLTWNDYAQIEMAQAYAYQYATDMMALSGITEDPQERMKAFVDKRPPVFKHQKKNA